MLTFCANQSPLTPALVVTALLLYTYSQYLVTRYSQSITRKISCDLSKISSFPELSSNFNFNITFMLFVTEALSESL